MAHSNAKPMLGRSIIELMIAIAIGMIIAAVLVNFYLASSRTYRAVDDNQIIDESGRQALTLIAQQIRLSGFIQRVDPLSNAYLPTINGSFTNKVFACEGGASSYTGATMPCSGATAFDSLEVNYTPPETANVVTGASVDCNGQISATPTIITNRYYIVTSGGNNTLVCQGSGGGAFQPMVENVEDFQLAFSVDDNADGVPDRILNASSIAAADWSVAVDKVVSVRMCLVVKSANKTAGVRASWWGCDAEGTSTTAGAPIKTAADGYSRSRFITNVALRN